ncbi:helix-turn-helix domain-containing protein [Photorhabdus khanii]
MSSILVPDIAKAFLDFNDTQINKMIELSLWWRLKMTSKMNELLNFAKEIEAAGLTDGESVRRIEARIKDRELKEKYGNILSMTGDDIKRIRAQYNISQSSLALILNMTKESVSKWERGEIKPNGAALRILNLIDQKALVI